MPSDPNLINTRGLSDSAIGNGLKEALNLAVQKAVELLSKDGGYGRNPLIRIPMPEQYKSLADTCRSIGFGTHIDDFELSMNRAAEQSAIRSVPIFQKFILDLRFEDVKRVLAGHGTGTESSATDFFKERTRDQLVQAYTPVVENAMNENKVTHLYKVFVGKVEHLPMFHGKMVNIESYTVTRALDGLFSTLAEEEKKLRIDPAARVTSAVQQVFGILDQYMKFKS